jgi:hypothetical protein
MIRQSDDSLLIAREIKCELASELIASELTNAVKCLDKR